MSSLARTRRSTALLAGWACVLLALPAAADTPKVALPELSPEAASVLHAAEADDRAELRRIAEERAPKWAWDPWTLAHELVLHGHRDAARSLANASTRPDARPLADYVRKLERRPPSAALWAKHVALTHLMAEEDYYGVRKSVDEREIEQEPGNVTAVLMREIHAEALEALGKRSDALTTYMAAATAAGRMGWSSAAKANLEAAKLLALHLRDDARLMEVLERLLEVGNRSADAETTAHALADLASVQGNLGNFDAALSSYREVLLRHGDALDTAARAHVHNMAGMAELNLGQIANAERSAIQSYDLARQAVSESAAEDASTIERERAQALVAMADELQGLIAMTISDYDAAERHYRRAEAGLEKLTQPVYRDYLAQVVSNRGVLEVSRDNLEEAQKLMAGALRYWEAAAHTAYIGRARCNLGEIDRRRAQHAAGEERTTLLRRAEAQLDRALRDLETSGDIDGRCTALIELGRVHALLQDYGRAHSDLDDALAIATDLASVALETEVQTERAQTYLWQERFADALAAAKGAAGGTSSLFDRLTPRQSALARHQTARIYEIGLSAAARLGGQGPYLDDAFYFLESGRAVALLMRLEARKDLVEGGIDEKLQAAETEARAREAKAYAELLAARGSESLARIRAARETLEQARAAYDDVIARIQLEEGWRANLIYPSLADRKRVEAALAKGEVLTLYGAAAGRAYVLLVRAGRSRLIDLGPEAAVSAACQALKLGPDAVPEKIAIGPLRDLVVKPLELGEDVTRVLLSTSGCLSYEAPSLLFPDRDVCCVASGTAWLMARDLGPRQGRGVLALGDPDYGDTPPPSDWAGGKAVRSGELVRLEGSGAEARAVGDVVLLREKASETKLREVLTQPRTESGKALGPWRAIHLACHGLVNRSRPALSGLALAHTDEDDGLLRGGDIARLRMNADLVVLSACDSGRGEETEGEGILGFTSMFQIAGARRVIVSLWKVDDEATRLLMIEFHRLWNAKDPTKRIDAAAALRAAQAYVRDYARHHGGQHPEWRNPHYWAAWQLWGPAD